MISVRLKGDDDFNTLRNTINTMTRAIKFRNLSSYARKGVDALKSTTPVDTGLLRDSWYYEITDDGETVKLNFLNSDIENGVPIAIIVQYGHQTGGGGWVEGRDYINPAVRPIFDELTEDVWKEVTNA